MESMSNAPYLLKKARFGYRMGDGELIDSLVYDGLTSTFDGMHMIAQNSKVSRELGISASRRTRGRCARRSAPPQHRTRSASRTRSSRWVT
jgi:Acetyl-CoA acetyltransferase